MMSPQVRKATPVLFVDRIESSLPFWHALGFKCTIEVAGDHGLNFCALSNDLDEVMYQTFDSVVEDIPQLADSMRSNRSFLFVEVLDLDAVVAALPDQREFMPRRQTFYGSHEIGFIEPGGHAVVFAQFPERQAGG